MYGTLTPFLTITGLWFDTSVTSIEHKLKQAYLDEMERHIKQLYKVSTTCTIWFPNKCLP